VPWSVNPAQLAADLHCAQTTNYVVGQMPMWSSTDDEPRCPVELAGDGLL